MKKQLLQWEGWKEAGGGDEGRQKKRKEEGGRGQGEKIIKVR